YKTIQSEKWVVFFILTIIGIIAIFNIIGSLTMLVIDKKQDMNILQSLGASKTLIQRIFFYEGVMIASIGSFVGIILGLLFCLFQMGRFYSRIFNSNVCSHYRILYIISIEC